MQSPLRRTFLLLFAALGSATVLLPLACSSEAEVTTTQTTGPGSGGGTTSAGGAGAGGNGSAAGLPLPTEQVQCDNKLYQCGDLVDNDGDGWVDYQDPDCLGPCDHTEDSFFPNLPGSSGQDCDLDCFWDNGLGHDENCYWDHHCDPNSDAATHPVANPQAGCSWDSETQGPVGGQSFPPSPYSCDEMFDEQPQSCLDQCRPLAPNGCDCFGCCELDGQYVWLGSLDDESVGSCTLAAVGAPDFLDKCHPCVPVPGCNNPCDVCELCIGKTTLPPECDPGEGGAGGGVPQQCPEGQQACGLPSQPACPSSSYCITGCCVIVPD